MSSDPGMSTELEAEPMPIDIGEILDGKFRIERVIGEGAVGLVVEATHLDLGERVAIKFLRPAKRGRADQVTRFAREARAAARLNSEHVAHVIDVGELPNGDPYMVMELLQGRDLDQVLNATGAILNTATAALYIIQACEALAEAHSVGIVHRDIKPANLFLVERGGTLPIIKLLDFGISKAALTGEYTDIVVAETKTTAIMGTPYYMAPEQVRSTRDVDHRADIWALGAVLFELVSGKTAWRAEDLGTLVQEILAQEPRGLAEVRSDIDPEFAAVVGGALMRDADKRYASAAVFARALLPFAPATALVHVERAERFVASSKVSLPQLWTGASKDGARSTAAVTAGATPDEPEASRRLLPIAIGVGFLLLAGGATAVLAPRFLARTHPPIADVDPSATAAASAPLRLPAPARKPAASAVGASIELPADVATAPPARPAPGRWPPAPIPKAGGVVAAKATDTPAPSTPPSLDVNATPAPKKPKQSLDENPWQKGDKTKLDDPFK